MNLKKFTAFTLAETLIVMGIIGVVAALTIPSLTNSTNNKDIVAKVRKAHSSFEDAFGRMIAQYGEMTDWNSVSETMIGDRLMHQMKTTKECRATSVTSCFTGKTIQSTAAEADPGFAFIMADGTSVGIKVDKTDCSTSAVSTAGIGLNLKNICGGLTIDVDGYNKGKNAWGIDKFAFYITQTGIYPVGSEVETTKTFANSCNNAGGIGCTAWVVYNGNMDYRKATSDRKCNSNASLQLDWAVGKTACD